MLKALFVMVAVLWAATVCLADWQPDEFLILCWGQPTDDTTAKAFADIGVNTVFCTPETLDLCHRHGLRGLVKGASPEQAIKLSEHPAVWGWFVRDEPKEEQFAETGERVKAFHEADLDHPAYVNLMAWMNLDKYLETVKPRFLSYDFYQWWWGPHNHLWRLEAHRNAALKAGLPLICWIEGNADGRWEMGEKGQTYLPDNEPKLRQSLYTSLAYGVKGIQWFNDFVIFQHAKGRKLLPELRRAGHDVKQLNAELAALGPTLMKLQSVEVFQTHPLPKRTRLIPEDCWVQLTGRHLTLGLFKDSADTDYVMVVNRDIAHREWAVLQFQQPVERVSKFDRAKGEWTDLPVRPYDGTTLVDLILRQGDGELLRVD